MIKMGYKFKGVTVGVVLVLGLLVASSYSVRALTPLPTPEPATNGFGLEATKRQAPPKRGASITTPSNGASFSTSPTTVTGICPTGLLVQILNNNVMVGSVMCNDGSFSIRVSLFAGDNELKAIVYDDLDQAGPVSNIVKIHFSDANISAFGQQLTLTSAYSRRAAATGNQLAWPLQLAGGTGPYAFSIDWGDNTEAQLQSQAVPGQINISHVYKRAGIYQVNIRVTDANNVSAFLQVIAVANGNTELASDTEVKDNTSQQKVIVIWVPAAIMFFLLFPSYWLGRRSQLISLRNKMSKERDSFKNV